jgi:hypothetical protein
MIGGVDLTAFIRLQQGIRVKRVSLNVELARNDHLSVQGSVLYDAARGGSRFLLHPRLDLKTVSMDGAPSQYSRSGPLVQLSDSPGTHRLAVSYAGSLPSGGGLGISGTSFDLNVNLLWYPILVGGSRIDFDLQLLLPIGATAVFPSVARRRGDRVSLQSTIDAPLVGGEVKGRSRGRGLAVYSLVRDDTRDLQRIAKEVVEWQEKKWGPLPFRPLRVVETWRHELGAYSREGLIVAQNLTDDSVEGSFQKLVHETAHQWWGLDVLPGESWFQEDWLSEGLATYCEYLWTREKWGQARAELFLDNARNAVRGMNGSLVAASPWTPTGWTLTRSGGLLVLVALENQVPNLLERLRRFRERHRGSFVTTRALMADLVPSASESWLQAHLIEERAWPGDLPNPDG